MLLLSLIIYLHSEVMSMGIQSGIVLGLFTISGCLVPLSSWRGRPDVAYVAQSTTSSARPLPLLKSSNRMLT